MDLRRLRSFVAVAEERDIARAADRVRLTEPALTGHLRSLESDLGVPLFSDASPVVALTPAGARLFGRATEILSAVDSATDEVRRVHAGEEVRFRLGFVGSATYSLMPGLARGMQSDQPELRLELTGELLSADVAAGLAAGRLDLGVLRPVRLAEGLLSRTLRSEPLVAALPVGHPAASGESVALAALASDPFVCHPRKPSATADAVALACAAAGFEPDVRTTVRKTATLVSLVASGVGVALVPESLRALRVPGIVYLPLSDASPRVDLLAAWRASAPPSLVANTLRRLEGQLRGGS